MSDFTRDYKAGDILYGRFDHTQFYWHALLADRDDIFQRFMAEEIRRSNCPKLLKTSSSARTLSELSDTMQEHAKNGQTHAVISYLHKGFKATEAMDVNLAKMATVDPQIPPRFNAQRLRYHESMYCSRYSPYSCVQIDRDTGVAAVGTVSSYDKYLRRASKFGALHVSSVLGVHVRFVLDGIAMIDVLEKRRFPKEGVTSTSSSSASSSSSSSDVVPITTSELRTLFRNWRTAQHGVTFYLNQVQVLPPWIADPGPWIQYAKTRCQKYAILLQKTNKTAMIPPFDMLEDADQLNAVADSLRRRIPQL